MDISKGFNIQDKQRLISSFYFIYILMNLTAQLIPNVSIGDFKIGSNINDYFDDYDYIFYKKIDELGDDLYSFKNPPINVYVDKSQCVSTISCDIEIYFNGVNLIGLKIEDCFAAIGMQPDNQEKVYLIVKTGKGQNQTVYGFDHLGLQIWSWRKKVVTVSCTNYNLNRDL